MIPGGYTHWHVDCCRHCGHIQWRVVYRRLRAYPLAHCHRSPRGLIGASRSCCCRHPRGLIGASSPLSGLIRSRRGIIGGPSPPPTRAHRRIIVAVHAGSLADHRRRPRGIIGASSPTPTQTHRCINVAAHAGSFGLVEHHICMTRDTS